MKLPPYTLHKSEMLILFKQIIFFSSQKDPSWKEKAKIGFYISSSNKSAKGESV